MGYVKCSDCKVSDSSKIDLIDQSNLNKYSSRLFCGNWQSEPKIYMNMQRTKIV